MLKVERSVLKKLSRKGTQSALRLRSSLSQVFHENTKLTPLTGRAYGQHVSKILKSAHTVRLMSKPYKVYTLMDRVGLDDVTADSELEQTIARRRSVRRFSGEPVTREELSRLLYFSYGRTDAGGQFRAVASGGALYPLEIYVVPVNVEGLDAGVYHYNVEHHCLDVVSRRSGFEDLRQHVWLQDMDDPEQAAAVLFVTAMFQRSTLKYLDRGYRLILMEAGEVAQNMSLLSTSMGLGLYLLGGFIDDAVSEVLGIDGYDEAPLLPIVVGRPAAKPRSGDG